MAKSTYSIPDETAAEVITCYCEIYGYQPTIDDQPNPETPLAFTERIIFNGIRQTVADWKLSKLRQEQEEKLRNEIASIAVEIVRE